MRVQEGARSDGSRIWLVLDDEYRPVEPVLRYLRYLDLIERSPNTLRAYAYDLKLFWEFLSEQTLDWSKVTSEQLSAFILWLRAPRRGLFNSHEPEPGRTEKTTNRILGTLSSFYEFYERHTGASSGLTRRRRRLFGRYKGFLHHAMKQVPSGHRELVLKEPRRFPGCLSKEQVSQLLSHCDRLRDKLLLCLLYEAGLRIGETLALRHEDMETGARNAVHVVPRNLPSLASRAKSRFQRNVDVSVDLMRLYSRYLIEEYPTDCECDFVFVQPSKEGKDFVPLSYWAVNGLFGRLRRQSGIHVTPHLFRHTHATELIRAGWNVAYVQNRLGHLQIQTTVNTYTHLTTADLDKAYREHLEKLEADGNSGL